MTVAKSFRENAELSKTGKYNQDRLMELTQSQLASDLGINEFLKIKPAMRWIKDEIARQIAGGKLTQDDHQKWAEVWLAVGLGFEEAIKKKP